MDKPCYNLVCPFRDKDENRCQLIACDWVGGTGREPHPLSKWRRAYLIRTSPMVHDED